MARDVRKLLKRKEKRNKREKDKRKERRKAESISPLAMLSDAGGSDCEFLCCEISSDAWEAGIGDLVVARELPDRQVICAVFLIDLFCLGIKDTWWEVLPRFELQTLRQGMHQETDFEQLTPAEAKKLVADAAAYAHRFGFQPHKDFANLQRIFTGVDVSDCTRQFTFGNEGRPFFIAGPSDSLAFQCRVLHTLDQSAGPGNFGYMTAKDEFDLDDPFEPLDDGEVIDATDFEKSPENRE